MRHWFRGGSRKLKTNDLSISLEPNATAEELDVLDRGLSEHAAEQEIIRDQNPLNILLRSSDGKILGGLRGKTCLGWLSVQHLWVDVPLRGQGYGGQLLAEAEREALCRGCHSAHLDTFSFQRLEFYQRLGYEVFGQLADFPQGHTRFYLKKTLKQIPRRHNVVGVNRPFNSF